MRIWSKARERKSREGGNKGDFAPGGQRGPLPPCSVRRCTFRKIFGDRPPRRSRRRWSCSPRHPGSPGGETGDIGVLRRCRKPLGGHGHARINGQFCGRLGRHRGRCQVFGPAYHPPDRLIHRPNSGRARSSSAGLRVLPCQPFRFSINDTPLP